MCQACLIGTESKQGAQKHPNSSNHPPSAHPHTPYGAILGVVYAYVSCFLFVVVHEAQDPHGVLTSSVRLVHHVISVVSSADMRWCAGESALDQKR